MRRQQHCPTFTHQEEAVILSRVLTYLHKDVKPGHIVLDQFRDGDSVSAYAVHTS
ncbi:hypothetical protein [Paenibacillus terrigena]|uniref:hypothetical protein n=1 Tax=Paenibacillus terrigena TaxID=369333 RepID=UPI001B7FDD1E|nr:hypothetical protein [Paenibacillus terrigena]